MSEVLKDLGTRLWGLVASTILTGRIPPEARISVPPVIGLPAKVWKAILELDRRGEPLDVQRVIDEAHLKGDEVLRLSKAIDDFGGAPPDYHARSVAAALRKYHRIRLVERLAQDPLNDQLLAELAALPRGGASVRGLTVEEVPDRLPETDWLVEGLVARGDIVVLAGEPAAGKSLLAAGLAIGLAKGDRLIFGAWRGCGRPRRVLVVDEEQHPEKAVRRLLRLADGYRVDLRQLAGQTLWWTRPRQGFSFRSREWIARLHETIADTRPDLLIIDSLRATRTGSEIDAAATRQFFHTHVYPIVSTYGCSVLFLHHTRKMPAGQKRTTGVQDDIAGADLVGAVDAAILLQTEQKGKPGEEEPERVLTWPKLREGPSPEPLVLRLIDGPSGAAGPALSLRLVRRGELALPPRVDRPPAPQPLLDRILELLDAERDGENWGRRSIAWIAKALGEEKVTVRTALDDLLRAGLVRRRKDKPYFWIARARRSGEEEE